MFLGAVGGRPGPRGDLGVVSGSRDGLRGSRGLW